MSHQPQSPHVQPATNSGAGGGAPLVATSDEIAAAQQLSFQNQLQLNQQILEQYQQQIHHQQQLQQHQQQMQQQLQQQQASLLNATPSLDQSVPQQLQDSAADFYSATYQQQSNFQTSSGDSMLLTTSTNATGGVTTTTEENTSSGSQDVAGSGSDRSLASNSSGDAHLKLPEPSMDYLNQLLQDKFRLEQVTDSELSRNPPIFYHLLRLLVEEIHRVRRVVFLLPPSEPAPLDANSKGGIYNGDYYELQSVSIGETGVLSKQHATDDEEHAAIVEIPCWGDNDDDLDGNDGPIVTLSQRVYVPVETNPSFNYVGRILGPRGSTVKQLETQTGCKILVRGGEARRTTNGQRRSAGSDAAEEPLHVIISVRETEHKALRKIQRAVLRIQTLLTPPPEGMDDLKKRQLIELAILNGNYRLPPHLRKVTSKHDQKDGTVVKVMPAQHLVPHLTAPAQFVAVPTPDGAYRTTSQLFAPISGGTYAAAANKLRGSTSKVSQSSSGDGSKRAASRSSRRSVSRRSGSCIQLPTVNLTLRPQRPQTAAVTAAISPQQQSVESLVVQMQLQQAMAMQLSQQQQARELSLHQAAGAYPHQITKVSPAYAALVSASGADVGVISGGSQSILTTTNTQPIPTTNVVTSEKDQVHGGDKSSQLHASKQATNFSNGVGGNEVPQTSTAGGAPTTHHTELVIPRSQVQQFLHHAVQAVPPGFQPHQPQQQAQRPQKPQQPIASLSHRRAISPTTLTRKRPPPPTSSQLDVAGCDTDPTTTTAGSNRDSSPADNQKGSGGCINTNTPIKAEDLVMPDGVPGDFEEFTGTRTSSSSTSSRGGVGSCEYAYQQQSARPASAFNHQRHGEHRGRDHGNLMNTVEQIGTKDPGAYPGNDRSSSRQTFNWYDHKAGVENAMTVDRQQAQAGDGNDGRRSRTPGRGATLSRDTTETGEFNIANNQQTSHDYTNQSETAGDETARRFRYNATGGSVFPRSDQQPSGGGSTTLSQSGTGAGCYPGFNQSRSMFTLDRRFGGSMEAPTGPAGVPKRSPLLNNAPPPMMQIQPPSHLQQKYRGYNNQTWPVLGNGDVFNNGAASQRQFSGGSYGPQDGRPTVYNPPRSAYGNFGGGGGTKTDMAAPNGPPRYFYSSSGGPSAGGANAVSADSHMRSFLGGGGSSNRVGGGAGEPRDFLRSLSGLGANNQTLLPTVNYSAGDGFGYADRRGSANTGIGVFSTARYRY